MVRPETGSNNPQLTAWPGGCWHLIVNHGRFDPQGNRGVRAPDLWWLTSLPVEPDRQERIFAFGMDGCTGCPLQAKQTKCQNYKATSSAELRLPPELPKLPNPTQYPTFPHPHSHVKALPNHQHALPPNRSVVEQTRRTPPRLERGGQLFDI